MFTATMMISVYGWLITVESERNFKSADRCNAYIANSLSALPDQFVELTAFGIKDMRCRLIRIKKGEKSGR